MRCVCKATVFAVSILAPSVIFGDGAQNLSITNYQLISTQQATATQSYYVYRADLVNLGSALASVTASVSSLDPFSVRIVPGQDTLNFAPVPANGKVTSSNTFTILVPFNAVLDPSKLQWTFQATAVGLTANPGPNQTVSVGALVTLDGSGSSNPSGVGTLSYSWKFASRPPGSSAVLFNNTQVDPVFVVDAVGTYVITLTVTNGVEISSASVMVTTGNSPPVAKAGPNQTVSVGSTVSLDGSGSSDVDGDPLTYSWTLTTKPPGSAATLARSNTVSPTFVVDKPGTYMAQLTVSDGISNSSASVTITTANTPPVARAGSNQSVSGGTLVQLDGAGSTDVDGDPLTYRWSLLSQPAGSTAVLSNPGIVNPTFMVDLAGTYVAQLIVNDGTVDSAPSTVTITTSTILAPTANAGPNQTVKQNTVVQLNGSGTDPQGLQLTYVWALLSKPAGSTAVLSVTTIMSPSFSADLPGTYVAQLIVNNGLLNSAPSTVTISTTCSQPIANPGPNQNVSVGATVTLNGSGSGDACQDPLTYAWSFTTLPASSAATLSGANSQSPVFVADLAGVYVVQLIVNNGFTSSTPATLTITASAGSSVPAAILLTNSTVAPGQSAPFQVTLATAAPSGGVFVMLSSSDTSIVTVAPANIFMPAGATVTSRAPTVTGIGVGSAIITAAAYGLTPASALVQVGSGSGGGTSAAMSFSPGGLTINGGATQNLTLNLSGPAPPGGLTASLNSSNAGVSTVPLSVTFVAGSTSVNVPVTGVALGSATITANAPTFANASAIVTVSSSSSNVSATWYSACWENATIFGYSGNFQAIDFALITPTPVTVQGTLFFAPNCNASQGMDNMNDNGALTGSTHMIQGFTHYPDLIPSSAIYWIGPRTADGQCAPGSPCSGCFNYTNTTISCSLAP